MRRFALAVTLLAACASDRKDAVATVGEVRGGTGLAAPVEVLYDGAGIPHVDAGSEGDAAYAVGYAQARDRFSQMDLFRRLARGRLSELIGDLGRDNDVLFRTLFTARTPAPGSGSRRIEVAIAAALRPELRSLGERFRDGVNRWLDDLRGGRNGAVLPGLYQDLGFGAGDLAPWELEDSLAVGRLQAWLLSGSLDEEVLAGEVLSSGAPADLVADLTRHAQAYPSRTLPPPASAPLREGPAAAPAPAAPPHLAAARGSLSAVRRLLARAWNPVARGERAGSNNWVLAPSRSASGNTLVANDPHLSLSNPANFHLGHVLLPDRSVAGVFFPGTPVVVIGTNDKVAWGDTVVGYDVTDVYVEKLVMANGVATGVRYAPAVGGAVDFVVLNEPWRVRRLGAVVDGDPIAVKLVPHHGPVVPGSEDLAAGTALTVRWTGQEVSQELEAFWLLNRARSVDDAFAAVARFGVGAQNFVFGDVDGHIGYSPHARVPIRAGGDVARLRASPPWLPLPGDAGTHEWGADVPDAELPQARDPAAGYVATANNDIDGSLEANDPLGGTHYWYAYTDVGFREGRIQQVLTGSAKHTLDGMTALQADDFSLLAARTVPAILGATGAAGVSLSADEQAARSLLSLWADAASADRFRTPTGLSGTDPAGPAAPSAHASQAAALFHVFYRKFLERVLSDDLAGVSLGGAPMAVRDLPNEQHAKLFVPLVNGDAAVLRTGLSLCNDVGAAPARHTCAEQALAAFREAVAFLRGRQGAPPDWRWGRIHQVRFAPPLPLPLPSLRALGPWANDGGLWTVDVANFSPWSDTFTQGSGPNVRFSAELTRAGPRWRAVIPGGQVFRAGAPNDGDQAAAWLGNEKGERPFTRQEVAAAARQRLLFAP